MMADIEKKNSSIEICPLKHCISVAYVPLLKETVCSDWNSLKWFVLKKYQMCFALILSFDVHVWTKG